MKKAKFLPINYKKLVITNIFILCNYLFMRYLSLHVILHDTLKSPEIINYKKSLLNSSNRDPIILIPGFVCSRIEYSKDNKNNKNPEWETLWLKSKRTLPFFNSKYIDDISVSYNESSDSYNMRPGIKIRPQSVSDLRVFSDLFVSLYELYFNSQCVV